MLDWNDTKNAYIYGVSIKERYRNQGLGTKLLSHAVDFLQQEGIQKIELTVDPENEQAIHVYKKIGFEITDLQEDVYGRGIKRYFMEVKIDELNEEYLGEAS